MLGGAALVGISLLAVALSGAGDRGEPFVGPDERSDSLCPSDMVWIPEGAFLGGASPYALGIPEFVPDIPRNPRPRQERGTSSYCIDRFEAPGEGMLPRADVTWLQARAACQADGKRLCTEDEWSKACGGPLGWLLPYGDVHVPGLCHADVGVEGRYDAVRPAANGTCASVYGVHDLEGSLSEWAEGKIEPPDPETIMQTDEDSTSRRRSGADFRLVLGGTMWPGVYGFGCQARHGHPRVAPVSGDDGYRCCRDPGPAPGPLGSK